MFIRCFSLFLIFFFFSSRRRHTRWPRDWSSDVCSSDLAGPDDEEIRSRHRESFRGGMSSVEDPLTVTEQVARPSAGARRVEAGEPVFMTCSPVRRIGGIPGGGPSRGRRDRKSVV